MIKPSSFWKHHFTENLILQRINWDESPGITDEQKETLIYSLKAWSLGETSEGLHLIKATKKYAEKTDDPDLIDAMRLFIKEENKHGNNLGHYIEEIGETRLERDWGDQIFRWIRGFNTNLEVWTITVIIVEYAAQIFYQALHDATDCNLLKSICRDILLDEAHHLKFQNERLHAMTLPKPFYARAFAVTWYCLLFFGTIHAIWFGHSKAFKAGGVSREDFMRKMYYKFFGTIRQIHGVAPVMKVAFVKA